MASDNNIDTELPVPLVTHLQLVLQRLSYVETDINRIGEKGRSHSEEIKDLSISVNQSLIVVIQRLDRLEKDLTIVFNRFWTVMLGVVGTVLALLIQNYFKK